MSRAHALYELQLVDSAIDERTEKLAAIESQLGESEALQAVRDAQRKAAAAVESLEKQVRDLAWQVQDLDAKIQTIDQKLYGGTIRNPKELNDLHQDLESHRQRKRQLEDNQLAIMLELEDAQQALRAADEELQSTEAAVQADRQRLVEQRDLLQEELEQLRGRREQAVKAVVEPDLHLYGQLRLRGRGLAVARVARNLCGACRIALSTSELHRVRTSVAPVTCSSCGRVIYAG